MLCLPMLVYCQYNDQARVQIGGPSDFFKMVDQVENYEQHPHLYIIFYTGKC